MEKKIKQFCLFTIIFILFFNTVQKSYAVEKVRFLSLKNNKVNVRIGPSKEYPIKFTYKKKYLPVKILGKSETWRKVKDLESNSGWIHVSQLSKKKTAININYNSLIYKKPTIYSKPIAKLEIGRLVLIKKCKRKWCKISSGNYSGWILQDYLWGEVK